MTERWCAWHLPAPIMFAHYGDGRKKVSRTHGICPKCLPRVLAELNAKAGRKPEEGGNVCLSGKSE